MLEANVEIIDASDVLTSMSKYLREKIMAHPQQNENNSRSGSGSAKQNHRPPQSAGETSIQAMLMLVREYTQNAAFFDAIVRSTLLEADLAHEYGD
jgi:hypothetical protein